MRKSARKCNVLWKCTYTNSEHHYSLGWLQLLELVAIFLPKLNKIRDNPGNKYFPALQENVEYNKRRHSFSALSKFCAKHKSRLDAEGISVARICAFTAFEEYNMI